jgi:photosystem II stability/assembly factor-like uncharacterized protein
MSFIRGKGIATKRVLAQGSFLLVCSAILLIGKPESNFWSPTKGPGTNLDVKTLAVNSQGDIFAGTAKAGSVWKSTDNGNSWVETFRALDPVLGLALNSQGHIFASVYLKGVYRSTDNGATWSQKTVGLTNFGVRRIVVDNVENLYVATECGIFKSTDNGDSWQPKNAGMGVRRIGWIATKPPDCLFATGRNGGSYRSTNNGDTWLPCTQSVSGDFVITPRGDVLVASGEYVFRSTDDGANWSSTNTGLGRSGMSLAVNSVGHIYGTDGKSVCRSIDDGATWSVINSGLASLTANALIFDSEGYALLGVNAEGSGGGVGVYRSTQPAVPLPNTVSISPDSGKPGTQVSISGLGFSADRP